MKKVQGKHWNSIYNEIKHVKVNLESIDNLLCFPPDISVHLLGVATLNGNGYVREKALSFFSQINNSSAVPYILLRLNDWVSPVHNLAENIFRNMLTADNIDVFIENAYLINKLQNVLRVNLKSTREEILEYLKDNSLKDKIKSNFKHPQVKTRLFCYMLLTEKISQDGDIIKSALKDKSYEIRMWLVKAIRILDPDERASIICKMLEDKSARVKIAVLRNYEDIVCLKLRAKLERLITDEHVSIRDEARFITKKHLFIKDFPEFYRQQIINDPMPGALVGLGETGNKDDFDIVSKYYTHEESKVRLASMIAMWYLSKEDAARRVLDCLNSDIPKIRKTARQLIKGSKIPVILTEMKGYLESDNVDIQLYALDTIYCYGGWQALEGILFAISKKHGVVLDLAKKLLFSWLVRSATLYSKPDSKTRIKIENYIGDIRDKGVLIDDTIRQLQFVMETRK